MCTENQIVSCKSESDLLSKFHKISQQRLLHYTYNYHCLLFLWFLLFSIFFELKKGTHGRLLFGTLCIGNYLHIFVEKRYYDTVGTIFKYCLYYLQRFAIFTNILLNFLETEHCSFYIDRCLAYRGFSFTTGKQLTIKDGFIKLNLILLTEVKLVTNRSPLSNF